MLILLGVLTLGVLELFFYFYLTRSVSGKSWLTQMNANLNLTLSRSGRYGGGWYMAASLLLVIGILPALLWLAPLLVYDETTLTEMLYFQACVFLIALPLLLIGMRTFPAIKKDMVTTKLSYKIIACLLIIASLVAMASYIVPLVQLSLSTSGV
jgi:hypothetical protein